MRVLSPMLMTTALFASATLMIGPALAQAPDPVPDPAIDEVRIIPMAEAIAIAEQAVPGSHAVEADAERDGWEIELSRGTDGYTVTIDGLTGTVVELDDQGAVAEFFDVGVGMDMSQFALTLREAVILAEQQTGAPAREAEIETGMGGINYEIEVARENYDAEIEIDPMTGQIAEIDD